ncbi:hypothetical protein AAMO2058_000273300 [Amorphochlora amoebiformis]
MDPVDGVILGFALVGALSAIYMVWRSCCRTNMPTQAYEMADQMDPDELKLQQILEESPRFFDDPFDLDDPDHKWVTRKIKLNDLDPDKLSDGENELGSDGELESDEELNQVDLKLASEPDDDLDEDDGGDVDLETDLTNAR